MVALTQKRYDYLRLLWWVLVMPQQLIAYREKFGEKDERRVGKWLVSTLTFLPLLMPSLALGLEWLPHSAKAWLPETYLWISAGLVGCWLLMGWLGDLDDDGAGIVLFFVGMAFGVALVVALGAKGIVAFFMAGFVVEVVEESLKTGTPFWLARLAFLLLIAAHLFLIVYCFLDGWRLFV
ncbi:MAG: hypothetical protein B6247_13510 [Candidatus Parabeggiatoa sp. nov. 2]|nr:MAG: hypothetical protein B6247_13510 [Beggiatoa sp. 4572_84]